MKHLYNRFSMLVLILATTLVGSYVNVSIAAKPTLESIWRNHIVPQEDKDAAMAYKVFDRLLQARPSMLIPPSLYVIDHSDAPVAALLEDGIIVLNQSAIQLSLKYGKEEGEARLAFVLAHELSHQSSHDLWQRKLQRFVGRRPEEERRDIFRGLQTDDLSFESLERKETLADRNGLVLMMLAGYDPTAVVTQADFFKEWVEHHWGIDCYIDNVTDSVKLACKQANSRTKRALVKLQEVVNQATLFELGMQAYVAGKYSLARKYFVSFGHEFPAHAVHTNIALTYLGEVRALQKKLPSDQADLIHQLRYPFVLESAPSALKHVQATVRSGEVSLSKREIEGIQKEIKEKVNLASLAFEKALQITPNDKQSYFHLISSYLIAGNLPMARGVLLGKYIPKYSEDKAALFLQATAESIDGNYEKAEGLFLRAIDALNSQALKDSAFNEASLFYSVYYNYALLLAKLDREAEVKKLWFDFAKYSQRTNKSTLFHFAREQIKQRTLASRNGIKATSSIYGFRLGQTLVEQQLPSQNFVFSTIWMEGQQLGVVRMSNGAVYGINKDRKLVAAWQDGGLAKLDSGIKIGSKSDRINTVYGAPSRQILSSTGLYLAYDNYNLAFHVIDGEVAGWFIY